MHDTTKTYHFISFEAYRHLSDEEIVEQITRGSTYLFEVLLRRFNQRLYRVLRAYIADEEAVKDTLQTTYMKAYEHLGSFRADAAFSTWITRIAINEAMRYLKQKNRPSGMKLVDNSKDELSDGGADPEHQAVNQDTLRHLENVIDTLPPKYRSVFLMREVEQMTTRETAACLDIPETSVKVRLHRAKGLLRDEWERRITGAEVHTFLGERCNHMVVQVMSRIGGGHPGAHTFDTATPPASEKKADDTAAPGTGTPDKAVAAGTGMAADPEAKPPLSKRLTAGLQHLFTRRAR